MTSQQVSSRSCKTIVPYPFSHEQNKSMHVIVFTAEIHKTVCYGQIIIMTATSKNNVNTIFEANCTKITQ